MAFRHLFRTLVWRNVRAQFDEMHLGFMWVFMRPLLYVVIFSVFRRLSNANTHVAMPYPLYLYSGLIVWYYFLESVLQTAGALRRDAALVTKIYYPRLITPAVPAVANLVGFGIATVPMVMMMAWYGVVPGWRIVLFPIVMLQCVVLAMGIGMVFAALSLASRDWEKLLANALYVGLFVSPVIYAPSMIPAPARVPYFFNPMAGTLLAFRSTVIEGFAFPAEQWLYSVVFSLAVLGLGVRLFGGAEAEFADRL